MDGARKISAPTEKTVIAAIAWFTRYYSLPFAATALTRRLPQGFSEDGSGTYVRAFDAAGLKARVSKRKIGHIDPGSLPVLLMGTDGSLMILVDFDANNAVVLDPTSGESGEFLINQLAPRLCGEILLVAPKIAATSSRLSPDARKLDRGTGDWLWSELGRHKASWAQVFLAALGVNLAGLALPIFVMNVFDRVIPNLAFVTLVTLAIGVALALMLDLALRLLRNVVIQRVSRRTDLALASRLFHLALSQMMLSRRGGAAGAITNLRDFEVVRDFFASSTLVSFIDLLFVGIFLTVLFLIVGPLTWAPIVAIPIILILAFLAQMPIARSARQAQQMNIKRNVVLIEALSGLETVKSVGAEPVLLREWENAVAASSRVTAQTRNWATFTASATAIVQQAVSVVIICWGVFLVSDGAISLGALIAANILAGRILSPLAGIAQTVFRANLAFTAKKSIDEFVETEVEHREVLRSDLTVRAGHVELDGVSFSYPGAMAPAVDNVTVDCPPGSTIALLGRIGSGKSTLGKLINATYRADNGKILIDSYEIAQYEPAELRAGVGYLPQDPVLFTGTIRENVTIGVADASDTDIGRALFLAGIDGFVASLPEGVNFFVGEKGERLSGGQRQCIALARLLLRKPKVLFLDEPTNSMDHQTEALVIERLRQLQQSGVGMILSTHRMSLAAIADRFVVLEKGRKVMDGPRETVLSQLNKNGSSQAGAIN